MSWSYSKEVKIFEFEMESNVGNNNGGSRNQELSRVSSGAEEISSSSFSSLRVRA